MAIRKQQAPKPDLARQLEVLCDFLEARDTPTTVFEALEAIEEILLSKRIVV
jgi:hypothetical protein